MLNILWFFMLFLGISVGIVTGNTAEITDALLGGGKEAVTVTITMAGIVATWTGLMKIAERAGLIDALSRRLRPLLSFLFPGLSPKDPATPLIATNFIANFLGLGWAATPAGLSAMKALQQDNPNKKRATNHMCTFLIINMSSVQLININILAYRSQYGSINPTEILGVGLLATCVSTFIAVALSRLCGRWEK